MVNFSFKKSYNFNHFNKVKYDHLWVSKGFFTTVTMSTDDATNPGGEKQLFSVGTKYVVSSY